MSIVNVTNDDASVAILELFPRQGEWRDGDYFSLPGNRLVELVNGHVEVLPLPSLLHQFIARLVFLQMHAFVDQAHLGIVMSAPTRVRISERHFREPDVLFVSQANSKRRQEQFWEMADLVVEIISPDDPDRDLVDKRRDYAAAGISEYWMIDPRNDTIRVLHLRDGEYRETIRTGCTEHAESRILEGFRMNVDELFAKARA
jgi:Uma2 family endonuclease